jgi:hypothetical protein
MPGNLSAESSIGALPEMSKQTRLDLIRGFSSELVYVRATFPMGKTGLTLKDGQITPDAKEMERLLAIWGPAVKPGDQVLITKIDVKRKSIRFEINGGPVKKKKWYQHIEVGMGGGTAPIAPDDPRANPRGSFVDLAFDKYVPDVNARQLKELLRPVFDFDSKSPVEAYLETVPPKVKQAIQDHDVLVGMNQEMVTYAKGRPPRKIREKDKDGVDYEEWIYGEPPKDVEFVRFVGDEVTRYEVMKVDGERVVRTEKEVDLGLEPSLAQGKDEPEARPANAPTLRRPGEAVPDSQNPSGTSSPRRPPVAPPTPPTPDGQQVPQYLARAAAR